jgi:hypothetical protein
MRRFRSTLVTLLMVAILAMLSFGGSFSCFASSGDSDHPTTQP